MARFGPPAGLLKPNARSSKKQALPLPSRWQLGFSFTPNFLDRSTASHVDTDKNIAEGQSTCWEVQFEC